RSHRDEEAGGNAVDRSDFAPQEGDVSAEAHGADAQLVGGFHDVGFQLGQIRIGIDVVHAAEQLLFGQLITRRTVTADPYPDEAGAAALSLGLIDAVQDALPDAVQIAPCAPQTFQLTREAVLDVLVFTAASLEDETDF